jgi:hypothetical protein
VTGQRSTSRVERVPRASCDRQDAAAAEATLLSGIAAVARRLERLARTICVWLEAVTSPARAVCVKAHPRATPTAAGIGTIG